MTARAATSSSRARLQLGQAPDRVAHFADGKYFCRVSADSYSLGKLLPLLRAKKLLHEYDQDGFIDLKQLLRIRNALMHDHDLRDEDSAANIVRAVERIVRANNVGGAA